MAKQECVTLFPEVEAVTKRLTDEQFGALIRAVIAYRFRGEMYSGDDIAVDIAFQFLSNQVDRAEAAKAAKSKAARSKWEKQREAEAEQSDAEDMQGDTQGCRAMQNDTEDMQSDAPILSVPILSNPIHILSSSNRDVPDTNAGNTPKPPAKRFVPPTVEQVREYCRQRNNKVEAQRFVDYYTSNGWMVGKTKMKDWKAAVRTWEKNEKPRGQPVSGRSSNPFLDMLEEGGYE